MKENNFFSIDNSLFLRGIATVLVVLAHYSQWYISMGNKNLFWMLLSKAGRYGVAIFFLVSGYGIVCSASKGLDSRWVGKRLLNVYIPYLCIQGLIHILNHTEWSGKQTVRYLLGLDTWFVFVILIFYILFFLVWKYGKQRMIWMTAGVVGISVLLGILTKDSVWYASNITFLMGVVLAKYRDGFPVFTGNRKIVRCGLAFGLFIICGVFYSYFMNRSQILYISGKITASVVWVIFIISLFPMQIKGMPFINRIGEASLEIYLIHGLIIQELSKHFPNVNLFVIAIVSFVLSLVTGQCIHWLSKRLLFSRRILKLMRMKDSY